jgi:uncharacterized SAM-binding protein YcdF (DUF218 family)
MTYLQLLLTFFLVLMAAGLVRPAGRRRIGLTAAAGLFLVSWTPSAALFNLTLEWRYPAAVPPAQEVGGIVVLAGGVYPPGPPQNEPTLGADTYVRCRYAAWLYRHWRAVPVYASGGPGSIGVASSAVMRRALEAEGVPADAIVTESESTSTYTNAVRTAALLRKDGIAKVALVTEAFHMWRAELCFRKQGIQVVPAPAGFRGKAPGFDFRDYFPGPKALAWSEDALHEWVGLVWYGISRKF